MSLQKALKHYKKVHKATQDAGLNPKEEHEPTDEEIINRLSTSKKALAHLGPKVWKEGSKLLLKPCREVTSFGYHIKDTIKDMINAFNFYEALGIAANQVGHNKRIIICKLSTSENPTLMINPVVEVLDEEFHEEKEGCLSFPGKYVHTKRPKKIKVKYINELIEHAEQELSDLDSTIVQHEVDHLNGILFTDHKIVDKKLDK